MDGLINYTILLSLKIIVGAFNVHVKYYNLPQNLWQHNYIDENEGFSDFKKTGSLTLCNPLDAQNLISQRIVSVILVITLVLVFCKIRVVRLGEKSKIVIIYNNT